MVIVAGHITVAPSERDAYLDSCREVIELARNAPGCLDFALSPDLAEPGRINVLERWVSQESVETFRGNGTGDAQAAAIRSDSVAEYDVADVRPL